MVEIFKINNFILNSCEAGAATARPLNTAPLLLHGVWVFQAVSITTAGYDRFPAARSGIRYICNKIQYYRIDTDVMRIYQTRMDLNDFLM